MTVEIWLKKAYRKLAETGISTARLDCLVLLEDLTGKDRTHLLAHPDLELSVEQIKILNERLKRRTNHEPLAYIRGKTEFYAREFLIDHRVLEPRPESETMITLLKQHIPLMLSSGFSSGFSSGLDPELSISSIKVVDVGCGSGALGLTAAMEIPGSTVTLIDIDLGCLKVARANAKKHKVTTTILQGNLLEPILGFGPSPLALLCNLPYVPDSHTINEAAMQEPMLAIFGGPDGLDLYRELFQQLENSKLDVRYVLTESLPFQHLELRKIAKTHGFTETVENDFIQAFEKSSYLALGHCG